MKDLKNIVEKILDRKLEILGRRRDEYSVMFKDAFKGSNEEDAEYFEAEIHRYNASIGTLKEIKSELLTELIRAKLID